MYYIPGLNTVTFSMQPMNGIQWGITFAFMIFVFLVMEAEKAVRRMLKASGQDTDDREAWIFDQIDSLESRLKHLELNAQPLLPPNAEGSLRGVTVHR